MSTILVVFDTPAGFSCVTVGEQLIFVFLLELRFDFLFVHYDLLFGFQKERFFVHFGLLTLELA